MKKLLGLLKIFRRDLIVVASALFNRDTPQKVRLLFLLAFFYLLSPVDVLPDAIPLAGVLDDAVVVPGAVYGLMKLLPPKVQRQSEENADRILKKTLIVGLIAAVAIFLWLALIAYGVYRLFLK